MSDFNNTVQTVIFPPSSGFQTQEIRVEFFDDDITETLTEFYALVARLASSGNDPADMRDIVYEPRDGVAAIGIIDDDGMSKVFQSVI